MATKKKASSSKKAASKKAAAAPQVPSAAKLKEVQAKLNEDTRLRNQFLKDPGAVLSKQGINLDPEAAKRLMSYTRELTTPQREIFGTQLQRVRIGVSVRIRIIVNIGVTV
jgi:hypothetical protein